MAKEQDKGKGYAYLQQQIYMKGDAFKSATCTPPSSLSVAVGDGGECSWIKRRRKKSCRSSQSSSSCHWAKHEN